MVSDFFKIDAFMQPENPAQLGGKIYEMMGLALSGKWLSPAEFQPSVAAQSQAPVEAEIVEPVAQSQAPLEAEVVEPIESSGQK